MDTRNNVQEIKGIINSIKLYQQNRGLVSPLVAQLEVLHQFTSRASHVRQIVNGDQVDVIDLLTFLATAIRERENQDILLKAVQILHNLSHNETVRSLLFETLDLTSPLAAVVLTHSLVQEDKTGQLALQLMQTITCGHRVDFHQPCMDELLRFLVLRILSGIEQEDLISPVLGTLANICRNNILAQSAIRNAFPEEVKRLMKILTQFFGDPDQTHNMEALSIFVSISIDQPEGQRAFFKACNVEPMLTSIFGAIVHKFRTQTWKYAADLLCDLLRHGQMKACLAKYKPLRQCINRVLSLLAVGAEDSVSDVFVLLTSLCVLPYVRQMINSSLYSLVTEQQLSPAHVEQTLKHNLKPDTAPLLACLYWVCHVSENSRVGELALDFLTESIQECICTSEPAYSVHLLAPVFVKLLTETGHKDCSTKTVKLIKLLTVMCSDKDSRNRISATLTCDTIKRLVDSQLSQGYSSYVEATSALRDDTGKKYEGTMCILLTLTLATKLQKQINGLPQYLALTLKDPRVQDFLALGLTSSCQEQVEVSLQLFASSHGAEDARPEVLFCSSIANLNRQKEERRSVKDRSTDSPSKKIVCRRDGVLQSKENRPSPMTSSGSVASSLSSEKPEDITVDTLIERMQSVLEPSGNEKTKKVIEVFEHHIKSLQVKEEHISDLLEAKTLALQQADRVIGQLRNREAFHAVEIKKCQGMLKQHQTKEEEVVAQLNKTKLETRLELEKQQSHYDGLLAEKVSENEKMVRVISDLTENCTELKDKLSKCLQEKETLSKVKDDLQRAYEALQEQFDKSCSQSKELEEQRKTLSKQLKERDASLQKLTGNYEALQTQFTSTEKERSELEKEKEELEDYNDKLRSQLNSSDNLCRELQQKTKWLDEMTAQTSKELIEKKSRISELEQELDKHNKIVSFINDMNLKAGKK